MAIPFVIAAGMTVLATAKAVSWICNVMSEKEREQQRSERSRSDYLREKARAAKAQQNAASQQLFKQMGQEHAEMLFSTIRQHRDAVAEVPSELEKLEFMISSEVSDKTSSPFRKSALRREYARIEDAIVRIKEYKRYLDFEEQRVKKYLLRENYELLLELDTADPLLPLEWLYPGKLVIVSMDEIGRELPRFGHRISFGKDDRSQKTLALQYNDDIPVLIRSGFVAQMAMD